MAFFQSALCLMAVCLLALRPASGYSVLSHEAVVDAMWDVKIKAMLLKHYPNSTPEDLKRAHGFAYGGAIIQDLGYYPHASPEFSDLTHYARTGDFIFALIGEAHDLNEFAFALGALSHYVSDLDGHRYATNVGEPMLYPKLRKKFGNVVTYEDSPAAHLETEFGFDVLEVAKGNFAPQAYHDFIGFYVAKDLAGRAFHDTYGLELSDLFGDFDAAVASYRSAVSRTIPLATRVAWSQRKDEIQKSTPGITHRRFVYTMKRSSYMQEWGKRYDDPTPLDKFLAFLLRLMPPVGPLKTLRFKMPTAPVEQLFEASFDRAVQQYRGKLEELERDDLELEDKNYDVGVVTEAGAYRLDDRIQAFWLHKLAGKKFATVTPDLREELLDYYSDLNAPIDTKKNPKQWQQTLSELAELKNFAPATGQ